MLFLYLIYTSFVVLAFFCTGCINCMSNIGVSVVDRDLIGSPIFGNYAVKLASL